MDGNKTSKSALIPIKGMTCAACVSAVERTLCRLKGVENVSVSLVSERAALEVKDDFSLADAVGKIKSEGYDVSTKQTVFKVSDMSCAACVSAIEKNVQNINGVISANVNLAASTASVTYIETIASEDDIKQAIVAAGYGAEAITEKAALDESSKEYGEYVKLRAHLIVSAVLSLFVFVGSMLNAPFLSNPYVLLIMASAVQFGAGRRFYKPALTALRHGSSNMNTLVAVGTSAAYFYSAGAVILQNLPIQNNAPPAHLYFDTSAMIITLILLGRFLELRARGKTSEAIKKLIGLEPKTAQVIRDNKEMELPINDVVIDDIVIIKPGQRIPVDGEVVEGVSTVDESMLTGEGIPVDKGAGDKVWAGTVNKLGVFKIRAVKIGKDSALAMIIKLIEQAQGSKAPIQRLADRVASVFVPIVILIAVITFILWYALSKDHAFTTAMMSFISVLIIACPCALGLATPTAIMVGSGLAAQKGILIRDAQSLELTNKAQAVIFDKTGTITKAAPELTDIIVEKSWSSLTVKEALQIAASCENSSEHPLGAAIVKRAKEENIEFIEVENFTSITGSGIKASLKQSKDDVMLGNAAFMERQGVNLTPIEQELNVLSEKAKSVIIMTINKTAQAVFALSDTIKEDARSAIVKLKDMGLDVYMITGDNRKTALTIADMVCIDKDKVIAEALPNVKLEYIKKLKESGKIVIMVGDGINDAPALAYADIGIALGSATDIAVEASSVTLIKGQLWGIVEAIAISRETIKTIKQNLFWAFFYNILGIPIAAGALALFNGPMLNPIVASTAMAFSSVSVVTNSLRLRKRRI
ncbi:heavy metal translocating P-type ATPase [Candidatus Magnetoovum chiemensis]|nr:heavy metal translocating P-type ATPase [Candidatus Magnetoovum chiemensis]